MDYYLTLRLRLCKDVAKIIFNKLLILWKIIHKQKYQAVMKQLNTQCDQVRGSLWRYEKVSRGTDFEQTHLFHSQKYVKNLNHWTLILIFDTEQYVDTYDEHHIINNKIMFIISGGMEQLILKRISQQLYN